MKRKIPRRLPLILLTVLLLHGIRHHVIQTRHPYPVEYGEGITLNWALRLQSGEALYPPVSEDDLPQIHNPYPPLYPLAQSLLSRGIPNGSPFAAGRLLSLFSTLGAAVLVGVFIQKRASTWAGGIGGCLFLLSPMMMRFGSMSRVDPLGVLLSLAAVCCLERGKSTKHLAASAFLSAVALLVKPTFIAAPLFLLLYLYRMRNPRIIRLHLLMTMLAGAAPLMITALWLWQRESPQILLHLWTLQGLPSDFTGAFSWFAAFAGTHAPVIALGLMWMITGPANDKLRLYAALTLLAPLFTARVTGSQENYLMETWAVLCAGSVISLASHFKNSDEASGQTSGKPPQNVPVFWIFLFVQLALFLPVAPAPVFTRTYGQELPSGSGSAWTPTPADRETGRLLHEELSSMSGPMLAADPGHLLAAHEVLHFQPFQFEHLSRAGKWNPRHLHDLIRDGHFTLILLKGLAETGEDEMFTTDTQTLIHEHYELHRVLGPWHLYRQAW